MSEQSDFYSELDTVYRVIRARDRVIERLEERVRELERRPDPTALLNALQFYADFEGSVWEDCEDDGRHGLFRQYITGTCHPREVARRALARAGHDAEANPVARPLLSVDSARRCEQVERGEG